MSNRYGYWVDSFERGPSVFPFRNLPVPVVLDLDFKMEADDLFALAYALMCPETVDLRRVTAAPCPVDDDGFEKVGRVVELVQGEAGGLLAGREGAADVILEESFQTEGRLVVVVTGPPTNVVRALEIDPGLKERVAVVWLGGHAFWHINSHEPNMMADFESSRALLDMDVPLVLLPCAGVATHLALTKPEVEAEIRPWGKLGAYLADEYFGTVGQELAGHQVMGALGAVAMLTVPGSMDVRAHPAPVLEEGLFYRFEEGRRLIDVCFWLSRSAVFGDFYVRLREAKG